MFFLWILLKGGALGEVLSLFQKKEPLKMSAALFALG